MKKGFLRPENSTQGKGNTKMNLAKSLIQKKYELRSLNQCYTSILLVLASDPAPLAGKEGLVLIACACA